MELNGNIDSDIVLSGRIDRVILITGQVQVFQDMHGKAEGLPIWFDNIYPGLNFFNLNNSMYFVL